MEIAGDTIAEFDAAALRLDGVSDPTLTLRVANSNASIIAAQMSWNKVASSTNGQFHWPAVFNRNEQANVFLLSNKDTQPVQALMQIKAPWKVPCEQAARGPLTYISFVETAPWNQPTYPRVRFKGIGTRLIAIASQISLENGLDGVLGLRSVPEAMGFYLKLGFKVQDCLNEYKELYLELDAPAAAVVRAKGDIRS